MTDPERLILTMEVNIAAFERAIEERFKPALRKAIEDVACDFMDGLAVDEIATYSEEPR